MAGDGSSVVILAQGRREEWAVGNDEVDRRKINEAVLKSDIVRFLICLL
jgi:hypothetical protein